MFKKNFKLSAPWGVFSTSLLQREDETLAYVDVDVKKGLRWTVKIYRDEEKKDLLFEANQEKFSLSGETGYSIKKPNEEAPFAKWVPEKGGFMNFLLRPTYKLMIGEQLVATAPGEPWWKLFVPKMFRQSATNPILLADGKKVAQLKAGLVSSGTLNLTYDTEPCEDENLSIALVILTILFMVKN